MFLSTERKSFLLIALCSFFLQACSSSQTNEKKDISLTVDTKSEFPFSTKEPEVYQADIVTASDGYEGRYFFARKGDRWRYDLFRRDVQTISEIHSDRLYRISHRNRVYCELPLQSETSVPGPFGNNEMGLNLFPRGHEHYEFEEIGREGSVIKYKIRSGLTGKCDTLIYVDTVARMITKQEFLDADGNKNYVYEIKNLKLEVDDNIFQLPEGYRKVTLDEYKSFSRAK